VAATHADTIWGILDYFSPKYKLPVSIVESSAGDTMQGFQNFRLRQTCRRQRRRNVSLVDLECRSQIPGDPADRLRSAPSAVRLAARLLDPDAYVICAGVLKNAQHGVATLSVKKYGAGSPLHSGAEGNPRWNDKRKYHTGIARLTTTAAHCAENAALLGRSAAGRLRRHGRQRPQFGTPVPSRIAIASTDYIAADRVGWNAMGIIPHGGLPETTAASWGTGQLRYRQDRRDRREDRRRTEEIPNARDIERELQWMGEMKDRRQAGYLG
jgi:uncharacterized protein (DUF362 family)